MESLDLPDLDKGDDADEVDVGTFELDLNVSDDEVDDASIVDAFEVDIQILTDSGSNEAASDLDVGSDELMQTLPDDAADREDDALHPDSAELDLHLDSPLESDEPSSDAELGDNGLEALPELVNEDGDGEAGPDHERAYLPSAPEGAIAQGPVYESEWLLLGTPCTALWAGRGQVLGAGEHLMRFGAERRSEDLPPGTRVSSLALLDDDSAILASTRGLLEVKAGASAALELPELGRTSGSEILELAATLGGRHRLWARASSGALLRLRDGAWERHDAGGTVRALTSYGPHITLLVLSERPTVQLSSDGGSSFRELLLPEPAATVARGAAPTAASSGEMVAVADRERGLCVSSDGGATFRMVIGAVNVTAIALGEHAGAAAVFAAVHRESKDSTELLAIDAESATPLRVAELSGEADEDTDETGRTHALVFAEHALWAAGGYGLTKLRPPRS